MGKASRDKGARFEREVVDWFTACGINAERVPLSGAAKGSYTCDVRFGPALGWTGECKRFATGLGKLYDAIDQDNADVVFARADRKEMLVCMTAETFKSLIQEADWDGFNGGADLMTWKSIGEVAKKIVEGQQNERDSNVQTPRKGN